MAVNPKWAKNASTLGGRIKQIRERQGLSLRQVAEAAGMARSYLHEMENTGGTPSVFVAYDLATALGVTIETLIGIEDSPNKLPQSEALELVDLRRRLARIERIAAGDSG